MALSVRAATCAGPSGRSLRAVGGGSAPVVAAAAGTPVPVRPAAEDDAAGGGEAGTSDGRDGSAAPAVGAGGGLDGAVAGGETFAARYPRRARTVTPGRAHAHVDRPVRVVERLLRRVAEQVVRPGLGGNRIQRRPQVVPAANAQAAGVEGQRRQHIRVFIEAEVRAEVSRADDRRLAEQALLPQVAAEASGVERGNAHPMSRGLAGDVLDPVLEIAGVEPLREEHDLLGPGKLSQSPRERQHRVERDLCVPGRLGGDLTAFLLDLRLDGEAPVPGAIAGPLGAGAFDGRVTNLLLVPRDARRFLFGQDARPDAHLAVAREVRRPDAVQLIEERLLVAFDPIAEHGAVHDQAGEIDRPQSVGEKAADRGAASGRSRRPRDAPCRR